MADSNITKRALASALRELMEEVPFDKIQIAHICERCDMNRKSFYYHFKDKYDLLNWILDTEFITLAQSGYTATNLGEHLDALQAICHYFYDNRNFYRKALKIEGQNSLSGHLREICFPLLKTRMIALLGEDTVDDFEANFFTDACMCAIERWLLEKDCMPPEQFFSRMLRLIQSGAEIVQREIKE
ncbi:MAG: TetR/AcrR family transcriptional regulator C-terminal domain-containing protein [bacterium]|nr:TetR/AcrR family transcriptional regulator C-terminal domain-containing protein [bacterium]